MNEKKTRVKSNLFESITQNTFLNLWQNQNFSDVTLATMDNQQLKAHKIILSSCSNVFRDILLNNPHPNPLIYLKGIRHQDLEMMLKFIYQGQIEIGFDE